MKNIKPLHELYKLWDQLGDIPTNEESNTDAPFLDFPAGAPTQEIWHWFERQNSDFVVGEVLAGVRKLTEEELQAANAELEEKLPSYQGYEKGFKDGVGTLLLALRRHVRPEHVTVALKEVFDAYQNNFSENDNKFIVGLNVVDSDGVVVDATTATLSMEQVSDIVDKSSQLVLDHMEGLPLEQPLAALHEALSDANVVEGRQD